MTYELDFISLEPFPISILHQWHFHIRFVSNYSTGVLIMGNINATAYKCKVW